MGSLTNNGTKIEESDAPEAEISSSASHDAPNRNERDGRVASDGASIALPAHVAGSGTLDRLVEIARDYAKASTAENTNNTDDRLPAIEAAINDPDPDITLQAICDRLESMRERTTRGRASWQPSSVKMLLKQAERLGLISSESAHSQL